MQFLTSGEETVPSSVINFRVRSFTSQTLQAGHAGALLPALLRRRALLRNPTSTRISQIQLGGY